MSWRTCRRNFASTFLAAQRTPGEGGRIKFLGGRLLSPEQLRRVELHRARKYLWVDGKVPVWINFLVHDADAEATRVLIMVADRLTSDDARLYHRQEGNPPFHVLGPPVPRDWVSLETSGQFRLRWRA